MVKRLTVSENIFLTITNGTSLNALKNTLGIAARHEFTVAITNGEYTLISCCFYGGENDLWLLFRNKALTKIIEAFTFPDLVESYSYQGTPASRIKSWDIDDPGIVGRIRRVMDAPALTRDRIVYNFKPYNGTGMQPLNILPALLLTGYAKRMGPRIEKGYEINEELSMRYDACRASLGMKEEEVETLFGKPLRIIFAKNGETARIYGSTQYLEINSILAFTGMAIVSDEKGRVTAIYSHVFFNNEWK